MTVIEQEYEFREPPRKRKSTAHLILHHAAVREASAPAIHLGHLNNGWLGIGYHYYVRKDGGVYRGRPEDSVGTHTSEMNEDSIGVCFEGNFQDEEMGERQLLAGRELIADILSRYKGISVSVHKDHNATACPGYYFPLEELLKAPEKAQNDENAPSEWARGAAQWAVENGIFVGDGSGDYRWRDYVTREELAVLLRKMVRTFR